MVCSFFQVLVWGGISRKGATPIVIFKDVMNSIFYQEKILRDALMPFLERNFRVEGHRIMQDNDPKHTSLSTREFMTENGINWWRTPPESPDLNPIERVWGELKTHVNTVSKPKTQGELVAAIKLFWATLTPERCCRYIDKIYQVIPAVVEARGDVTKY